MASICNAICVTVRQICLGTIMNSNKHPLMNKKKENRDANKISERSAVKRKVKDSYNRRPNPDDPFEKTGLPIKEMPKTSHPHREEILD